MRDNIKNKKVVCLGSQVNQGSSKQLKKAKTYYGPSRHLRASIGSVFKSSKKIISVLNRPCIRKQHVWSKSVCRATSMQQRSHCSGFSVSELPSSLDPIVAASFDADGTPTVDHVGRSSLHIAMGSTHIPTLEFAIKLFKRHNMLSCRDNANFTPLHMACCIGNYQAAKLLLHAGASPNELGGDKGTTPLHEAVNKVHLRIVKLLIDFGADIKAQDKDGKTVIEIQTSVEVCECVQTLAAAAVANACDSRVELNKQIGSKELPTIYVIKTSESSNLRPFMLLSDLCDVTKLSEQCFTTRYQHSLNFLKMENSAIASRIINPYLRDKFEKATSSKELSTLIEVTSSLRELIGSASENSNCSTASQSVPKDIYASDSDDTVEVIQNDYSDDDELQNRFDLQGSKKCSEYSELVKSYSTSFLPVVLTGGSELHSKSVAASPDSDEFSLKAQSDSISKKTAHGIHAGNAVSDNFTSKDLNLDSNNQTGSLLKDSKSTRRNLHPILQYDSRRRPKESNQDGYAPPISLVPASQPCPTAAASMSFCETSSEDLSLSSDKSVACALANPIGLPSCRRQPTSSDAAASGRSTSVTRKLAKTNKHPGDIYAATGVKPCSLYLMLAICKNKK